MTVLDVSYAQSDINWDQVIAANPEGVWIRASHGTNQDTHLAVNAAGAFAARDKHGWKGWIGYYHFAEYMSNEVPFQAAINVLSKYKPDRVCIDVEGKIPSDVVAWLDARLPLCDTRSPEPCWLYSYEAEAQHLVPAFQNRKWWIARVADGQGNPGKTPPSYGGYALWQFSWVEHWSGIAGHVDGSHVGPGFTQIPHPQPPQPTSGVPMAFVMQHPTDAQSYWEVNAKGAVYSFGKAQHFGNVEEPKDTKFPIVSGAPTPDGKGYRLLDSNGGLFCFGNAPYEGTVLAGKVVTPK